MLRLSGSLVDQNMNLVSQSAQPVLSDQNLSQEVNLKELNSLLTQIFANQFTIINKLTELEQRLDRNEQLASRKFEHLADVESTKIWFEESFEVKEFKIDISSDSQVGTKFPFKLPIINKRYQRGLVSITLEWIGNKTAFNAERKDIVEKITNQTNVYLKDCESNFLKFHSKISPSVIDLEFSTPFQVQVNVKSKDIPSSNTRSFFCIGVAEDNHAEPGILLRDAIFLSKINSHSTITNKTDAALLQLLHKKDRYVQAYWYDMMISLSKQKGLGIGSLKALAEKRARSEEVEKTNKRARTSSPIRAVEEPNMLEKSAGQDNLQLRSKIIDTDQMFFLAIHTAGEFFPFEVEDTSKKARTESSIWAVEEPNMIDEFAGQDNSQLRSEIIDTGQNVFSEEIFFSSIHIADELLPFEEEINQINSLL
jgi:hypothetical protein